MSDTDIMNLGLNYYNLSKYTQGLRSIFESNFNQDTLNWYYGMCAATIAGLTAYKFCGFWQPWVGVAGLVAAGAGAASMVTQLVIWCSCSEFLTWVEAIINTNSYTASSVLNSSVGLKILGISAATAGVVAYCFTVTPEVASVIIETVISAWNQIITTITKFLPDGVTLIINGIRLVTL